MRLRRKPMLIAGAAAVGVVGVVVVVRKRAAAGAGGVTGAGAARPATIGNPASLNTTGSDVAWTLGQFGGDLQAQLDAYQRQLNDTAGVLRGSPNPSESTPPAVAPPAGPPAATAPVRVLPWRPEIPGTFHTMGAQ